MRGSHVREHPGRRSRASPAQAEDGASLPNNPPGDNRQNRLGHVTKRRYRDSLRIQIIHTEYRADSGQRMTPNDGSGGPTAG